MIDNQYRYGIVYNLVGQIVGFNLSPDVFVPLTDDEIEKALENYVVGKSQGVCYEDKMKILDKIRSEIGKFAENPNLGDLSLGASCGAIKAIEIIDKYREEQG